MFTCSDDLTLFKVARELDNKGAAQQPSVAKFPTLLR